MNAKIRRLTSADIPAGMRLKDQNGWNTLPEDWQRQLDLEPEGCFAAELDEQVVGTACACVFDVVAWINLVLVDKLQRGRGIGTRLMHTVLTWLDQFPIPSIRLDATPLGRPIYEKLGFGVDYELTRHEGILPAMPADAGVVAIAQSSDLPILVRLDQGVTGTNREKLIGYLLQRLDLFVVRNNNDIAGYAAIRPGSRARHIGPCLGNPDSWRPLLAVISRALAGDPVYMDIPVAHAEANALAVSLGLTPQRRLTRMSRGARVHEQLDHYWCSFGPEKG